MNVPYDCGVAIVAHPEPGNSTMGIRASYLMSDAAGPADPQAKVPELSRRARGVPVWAVLRSLGREGVADFVARLAHGARSIAEQIAAINAQVLNDVVYTRASVAFGDDERTREVRPGCSPTAPRGCPAHGGRAATSFASPSAIGPRTRKTCVDPSRPCATLRPSDNRRSLARTRSSAPLSPVTKTGTPPGAQGIHLVLHLPRPCDPLHPPRPAQPPPLTRHFGDPLRDVGSPPRRQERC
ncbi:hypothetical protein AB0M41_32255 [Streptomyces sp. NPDC051896]|uniref:hypothetical protein n=1 Tax=Streptomyces sp. NPDC051896 TaxID=3155416 RepID=UPI0034466727